MNQAQAIADHIRRRIVTGDLRPGRRLPSVPRLAKLFGVSGATALASVHILEALGLVRVSHGVGTFVLRPRTTTATLVHGWLASTPMELALMREMIDERMPVVVARRVATQPGVRLPRTLDDILFLAQERSLNRTGFPERFLESDFAFHAAIARSIRGAEITAAVSERIAQRLKPQLMAVADVQAADEALHDMHVELARAILDGRPIATARLARTVARRELASLGATLGGRREPHERVR